MPGGRPVGSKNRPKPVTDLVLQRLAELIEHVSALTEHQVMLHQLIKERLAVPTSSTEQQMIDEDGLLKVDEAMKVAKVGKKKLYHLIRTNQIDAPKIGKSRRVTKASLRRLIKDGAAL